MKKSFFSFFVFVFYCFFFASPLYAACNPPQDYSDCPVGQTGPKIAGNIDPQNYQQIRNEYNRADSGLTSYQIPVTVIYTTADLSSDNIQETTANLQAMRRYGLYPIIRVASSGWGQEGWSRITPTEAATAAQSLNQVLTQVQFSQNPVVYFGNEPNLPQEWGGTADPLSFANSFAAFIQAAGAGRVFQIFVPPVATHQGGVEYQFMQQILNHQLPNGQTIAQSVDGAALTVYDDSPQSLSALYQQLSQFYQQNGVGNFVISELGPLVDGRLLQNREDMGEWTRIMSDVFAEFKSNPALFADAQFISTSFFLDTDGDGAPDVTLLVIIDADGNVIILNLATLGGGIMMPITFGACQSETPGDEGAGTAWGKSFEAKVSSLPWEPEAREKLIMTLRGLEFEFPQNEEFAFSLEKSNEKLTPAGYSPEMSQKTAMGEVWYEVCDLTSQEHFTVRGDLSFDTPGWMDFTSSLGTSLKNFFISSGGGGGYTQETRTPQVAGEQTMLAQAQACSADKSYEIVPSCNQCGDMLFCWGNHCRRCETDPRIPGYQPGCPDANPNRTWNFSASDFPSGKLLYNSVEFSVPSGGVYLCDSNVYGCNNDCFESLPAQPRSFCEPYAAQGGNQFSEEICIGGQCKQTFPPTSFFQWVTDQLTKIQELIFQPKTFLVTPVIKTPHALNIDNSLREEVFSTFKPASFNLLFQHTLTPALHEVSGSSEDHPSDSEIYGQKGVEEAYDWTHQALTPSALLSL